MCTIEVFIMAAMYTAVHDRLIARDLPGTIPQLDVQVKFSKMCRVSRPAVRYLAKSTGYLLLVPIYIRIFWCIGSVMTYTAKRLSFWLSSDIDRLSRLALRLEVY